MKSTLYKSAYILAFIFTLNYIGGAQYTPDTAGMKRAYFITVMDGYNIMRSNQRYAIQQDSISNAYFGYQLSSKADRVALDSIMSKNAFSMQASILNQRISTTKDSAIQGLFLNGNVLSISNGNAVILPFLTTVPSSYMKYSDTASLSSRIDGKQQSGAYLTSIPSFYMRYQDTASLSGRIDGKQPIGNYALSSQIPTNNNQLSNGAAYITTAALTGYALTSQIPTTTSQLTNNSGFITSVPAQSFGSITAKPTTLAGYGILDAYPLASNPSGFLASVGWAIVTGKPNFATVATSGIYSDLTGKPTIPTVPSNVSAFTNDAGYITTAPATNLSSSISGFNVTIGSSTGTGTTFAIPQSSPIFSNAPGRALNAAFRPSTTRATLVSYSVSVAALVTVGQAICYLELSPDNTTWTTVSQAGETSVALLNTKYYNIQCVIPAGYYCRLRSAVTGGATVAPVSGQEFTL